MTWFKNTPSTKATYSSRLVPFPAARGPNVLTWNRMIIKRECTPPPSLRPQIMQQNIQEINTHPSDQRAGHELLQKGSKNFVLHFTAHVFEKRNYHKKKIRLGNCSLNVEVEINESLFWHGKKIPSWRGE